METWSKKQVFVDVNIWFRNKFQVQVMECFVKFFIIVEGCYLILLVTEGRMQNFPILAQSLLGEFGWGLLLFFFLFLLPNESKVNSQFWTGLGVWQYCVNTSWLMLTKTPPNSTTTLSSQIFSLMWKDYCVLWLNSQKNKLAIVVLCWII